MSEVQGDALGEAQGEVLSSEGSTRGGLANAGASLVGTALTFAVTFMVTYGYGEALTGVFFSAVAIFMIVATAAKLGAETALVLFVARMRSEGVVTGIAGLLRTALGPVLIVSVAAGVAVWLLAPTIAGVFDEPENIDAFTATMRGLAPFVPAWSLSLCLLGATRGAGTLRPTALGLQIIQPAAQFVLVGIAALLDWDLARVAWCWAIPTLVTAGFAAWALRRWWLDAQDADSQTPNATEAEAVVSAGEFWRYAGARGVAGSLQMGLDRIGVVLVGALGTAALAGQWAAIARLVGVAQRFFHSIGQGLNPRVSGLVRQERWPDVQRAVVTATDWTILAVAPVLVALAVFPRSALGLFGAEFRDGSVGLIVAAAAVGAAVLFAHADNVLLMAGDAKTAMVNTAAALAALVVLHLLLVPPFGVVGAALAMGGGVAVYRLSSALQIRRRYGVTAWNANTVRIAAAAGVLVGIPALAIRLVFGDRLVVALAAGLLCAALYAGGVWSARSRSIITLSDLRSETASP